MNHQDKTRHFSNERDCPRRRLAETDIGSVDLCDCGMWQVHIGALTLRFAPAAVSELLGLLGQAVAEHAAQCLAEAEQVLSTSYPAKGGDA